MGLDEEGSDRTDFVTNNYYHGWKLHIHDPYEFPEVARKGIIMDIGSEVSIHLTGHLFIAVEVSTDISGILKQYLDKTVNSRSEAGSVSD